RTIVVGVDVVVVDVGSGDVRISTRAPIALTRSTVSALAAVVAVVVVVPAEMHDPVSAGGIASVPDPVGGDPIGGVVVSDVAVTVAGICGLSNGGEPGPVGVGVPPPPAPPVDATVPVLPGVSWFEDAARDRPIGPIPITLYVCFFPATALLSTYFASPPHRGQSRAKPLG